MQRTMILGIMVFDRIKEAGRTQKILTKHAGIIRTRLGFHELSADVCSRLGTIILILQGEQKQWQELHDELMQIGGVEVQSMKFNQ
jgi:metal-responsive CopG/Arc/MetJ family transcriptional regulator